MLRLECSFVVTKSECGMKGSNVDRSGRVSSSGAKHSGDDRPWPAREGDRDLRHIQAALLRGTACDEGIWPFGESVGV